MDISDKVAGVGVEIEGVGVKVEYVNEKVQVVIDGAGSLYGRLLNSSNVYAFRRPASKSSREGHR